METAAVRAEAVEKALYRHRQPLFGAVSIAFFDTTTLWFEGAGGATLGQRGHSKDYHGYLKQVVLGIVFDDESRLPRRPPPEPSLKLWCLKSTTASKALIINLAQIETTEVGFNFREVADGFRRRGWSVSDSDTIMVDSLKALEPVRLIR